MFAFFGLGIQEIYLLLVIGSLFLVGPVIGVVVASALARKQNAASEARRDPEIVTDNSAHRKP